jgi:predicted Rossmann fold nucleotide-binding protein DprA/Smf involved in DNA uptake
MSTDNRPTQTAIVRCGDCGGPWHGGDTECPANPILDYIRRGRVSVSNVASHFGVMRGQAVVMLRTLEERGAIRRLPGAAPMWEAINGK